MAKNLKPGDAVSWKSSSGDAQGNVVKKITTPTQIKGHKIAASRDNPRVHRRDGRGKTGRASAISPAGALNMHPFVPLTDCDNAIFINVESAKHPCTRSI